MLKIGYKSTLEAAILDLRKVIIDHIQTRITLTHHAKNVNDVMNNNGDIAPKVENLGNKSAWTAAILDMTKVNFGHILVCMALKHHAKNENDVMNNHGDIGQYFEN